MTKKKSILIQVLLLLGICSIVIGVLMLTGCSNNNPSESDTSDEVSEPTEVIVSIEIGESIALGEVPFDGNAYFATSTVGNMTNQEAFDFMINHEGAVFVFLNLVDEVLLRGNVEINSEELSEFLEELKVNIPDFDTWMLEEGFASEAEIMRVLELDEFRQAAVRHLVNVTEEDIEEAFDQFFDPDMADLEDVRDDIYEHLVEQQMQMFNASEVAHLRYVAGFEIFNETLNLAYGQYLDNFMIEVDLHEVTSEVSTDVIARINGVDITIGQLFEAFSQQFGLELVFEHFDELIINEYAEVDPQEVNDMIDGLREEMGDEFDAAVAAAGFESDDALFEYFERFAAEDALINEHFAPTDERLEELHAERGESVSASHILVDDHDFALSLIEQLQAADDDFSELFYELAMSHSFCPSSASGGDLGTWRICFNPGIGCMDEAFDEAVSALEVDEFTAEPVETQFGYHIIYKTGAYGVPEFADIRDELLESELAVLQNTPGIINELMATLRLEIELTFSDAMLQTRFELLSNREG